MLTEVTNLCMATNSLPRTGGLLDQDTYFVLGMMAVIRAQDIKHKMEMEKIRASRR